MTALLLGETFSNLLVVILAIALPTSSPAFSAASTPPARVKDTKVAVGGKSTFAVVPPPNALPHNVTLTNYMRLPVEQYVMIPMPLGSSLTRVSDDGDDGRASSISVDGTEFELVVPNITFFKLSLQPVVYASVKPRKNRVVISSSKCVLRGSPFIEKVKLNDRFDFCVETTLTWEDGLSGIHSAKGRSNQTQCLNDAGDDSSDCSITAETCIKVDVDVPRPFSSISKRILVRTGNAAMKFSLNYIQANFVDNLTRDYAKWATDLEYRNYRTSLSQKDVKAGDALLELGEEL